MAGCEKRLRNSFSNLSPCSWGNVLLWRKQGAKKVGKATFTGCFPRQDGMEGEEEGAKGGFEKLGRGWLLDDERTARQDCIGSWGTDRERGVGVERNTRGWERRTISILIPPWGVDVARTNRRTKMRIPMVRRGDATWWKRRESVLQLVRTALHSRLLLPRPCRFIPVLLPRHTCFYEYGGPRCARIFAAPWNFVISAQGILNGFPSLRHRHWKKPRNALSVKRVTRVCTRASNSWHR